MREISDDELVLHHFRDGLDAQRSAEIASALKVDADLSERYAVLQALLGVIELDVAPEPSTAFSERLGSHIDTLTSVAGTSGYATPAPSMARGGRTRRRLLRRVSAAAAALLLIAIGFQAGRYRIAEQPAPAVASAPRLDGARIYQATLVRHLGSTRQALLTAVNDSSGDFEQGNAQLAQSLIENNRLYLSAAEANGDRRLVELLRTLEPVLIELANPASADDIQLRKGVSDFVERSDLVFQVRAAEAGLRSRTLTRI